MSINKSAVIFDCDGVLFDSRQANINFYNHLLMHFGEPPMGEEEVAFVHMHTADDSVRRIFKGTPHLEEALAFRWKVDYSPFLDDMIMEPGLKDVLDLLKPSFGLAVATNRSNTIEVVLERNGLSEYFDIVISSLDVTHPKPHPESLLKILSFFDLPAADTLYVGDSLVDYETARAAEIPFVAYKNRGLDADFHVDGMMEIADLVLAD